MSDFVLKKPQRGETSNFSPDTQRRLVLDFDSSQSTLEREDNNLVMKFEDKSRIVLNDFYTSYSSQNMPSFIMQGVEVDGKDFFATLGEELMPAAGGLQRLLSGGSIVGTENGQLLNGGVDASEGLNSAISRLTSVRSAMRSLFDREESNDLPSADFTAGFTPPADGDSGKENDFALFDALNPDGEAKAVLPYEDLESIRATASGDIDAKGADGVNADGFFVTSIGGVSFGADGKGEGTFIVEGRYGNEELVLTKDGNTITAQTDSFFMPETYFTLTLNQDGTWEMKQFVDFALPNESKTFDMVVSAEDKDGDVASLTVNIDPFEPAGIVVVEPAEVNVDEAHLADGTNPDAAALVKTGAVAVTAPDGLTEISLQDFDQNPVLAKWDSTTGEWVFAEPQATDYGTIAIESITGSAEEGYSVNYKYTFTENASHVWGKENDDISLRFSDRADSYKYADIDINVVDDTLVLFDSTNTENEDVKTELVYPEGEDEVRATASGDIDAKGADGVNADGFFVTSIGGVTFGADGKGEGTFTVEGRYGNEELVLTKDGNTITAQTDSFFMPETYFTLTLNQDGTWEMKQFVDFALPNESKTFDMVVSAEDKDGDVASLTVNIDPFEPAGIVVVEPAEVNVDEAHLADGTNPDAAALVKTGAIAVTAPDGLTEIALQDFDQNPVLAKWDSTTGEWVFAEPQATDYGTIAIESITGSAEAGYSVNYKYTFTENASHVWGKENDDISLRFSDRADSYKYADIDINVVDDTLVLFDALNSDGEAKAELPYEGLESSYDEIRATASGDIDVKGADGINTDGMYVKSIAGITFDENGQGSDVFTVQGRYGDENLVLTRDGDTITAKTDSWFMPETYFTLTLNDDGTWTMQQMEDFSLKDSTTFDMVVGGVDKDGDAAEVTVKIDPFEAAGITITKEADDLAPDEANLANGTNPDADALVKTGTVGVSAPDGLVQIVAQDYNTNPTIATWDPATDTWSFTPFDTEYGTVVITSMAGDAENGYTFTYQYTLNENADYYGNDSFSLQFKDKAGEYKSEYVSISIVDDAPLDPTDMDVTFAPEAASATTTFELNFGADNDDKTIEINGFKVQYDAETNSWENYYSWDDDVVITKDGDITTLDFGDVTLANDGSNQWTATFDELEHGQTITKTITIEDSDYDKQSFDIKATWDAPVEVGTAESITVDEAHLANGTAPVAEEVTQSGSVSVTAKDGLSVITLGNGEDAKVLATWNEAESKWDYAPAVNSGLGMVAIAGITGSAEAGYTVNYSYTLGQNTLGESGSDSFILGFKDSDTENTAETGSVNVNVNITDDGMILFDTTNPDNDVVNMGAAADVDDYYLEGYVSGDIDVKGADGISDMGIYVKSLAGITFDADGKASDTLTVARTGYGEEVELTLTFKDGVISATHKATSYWGSDKDYFKLTLNEDGTWNMKQYEDFALSDEQGTLDMVVGASDNDGDDAELTVKINPDSATKVDESHLPTGSDPNAQALTQSGSVTMFLGEDLSHIIINDWSLGYPKMAAWNDKTNSWDLSEPVATDNGTFVVNSVTGNGADGYTVHYSYTLMESADHGYGSANDNLQLKFTGSKGEIETVYANIDIVDDTHITPEDVDLIIDTTATIASGTFEMNFGADDDDKTIEINGHKVQYDAASGTWSNYYYFDDDVVITAKDGVSYLDFGDVTLSNSGGKEWTITFDEMVAGGTASKEITIGDGDGATTSFDVKASWKSSTFLEDITADLLADTPYEDRLLEYFAGPQDGKAADELAQSLADALTYKKLASRDNIGDDKAERQEYLELKDQMDKGSKKDDIFDGEEDILIGLKGNDLFIADEENHIILGGKGDDLIKMDNLSFNDVLIDGGDGMDVLLTGVDNLDTVKALVDEGKINNIDLVVLGGNEDTANAKSVVDVLNGINDTEDATAKPPVELADKWKSSGSSTLNGVEYREYTNATDDMTILISKEVLNIG